MIKKTMIKSNKLVWPHKFPSYLTSILTLSIERKEAKEKIKILKTTKKFNQKIKSFNKKILKIRKVIKMRIHYFLKEAYFNLKLLVFLINAKSAQWKIAKMKKVIKESQSLTTAKYHLNQLICLKN